MRFLTTIALAALLLPQTGCSRPASSQDVPDAVAADPGHYTVMQENDVIRVLRVQYGVGETSVMHRHPANCAIFVLGGSGTFDMPGAETVEWTAEPGDVMCGDAVTHLPANTGEAASHVVVVEFKGRETFEE